MKRKSLVLILVILFFATLFFIYLFFFLNKSDSRDNVVKTMYNEAIDSGFNGDFQKWIDSLPGEYIYAKDGTWWIEDINTKVFCNKNEESYLNNELKEKVVDIYCDIENHLIIKCSDGSEIDFGFVAEEVSLSSKYYVVRFKDSDNKLIKIDVVKSGGSAVTPDAPNKEGCLFDGWDKQIDNVSKDIEVKAKYVVDSESMIIKASDAKAKSGEKNVEVVICVSNNPGVLGMMLSIFYDEDVMNLVEASNGNAFDNLLNMTHSETLKSGCRFLWDGQSIESEDIHDGNILILKFDVFNNTGTGIYPIDIRCSNGDVIDNELNPIAFYVQNGSIEITE